jgi:secretion/DNA translocation related TadE-like protein
VRSRGGRAERGAATAYAAVVVSVVLLLGCVLAVVAAVVVDLRRAQSAADLAALAGAVAAGSGEDPCAAAGTVAAANGAVLISCAPSGREVSLEVRVTGPRWLGLAADPTARARAGPAAATVP